MGGMAGKLAMTLSMGLDFIGMGAFSGGGGALLDGSEADGTNLLSGTDAMTSAWGTAGSTLTNAAAVAPSGATVASFLKEGNAGGRHMAYITANFTANTFVRASVYGKINGRRYLQILGSASNGTAGDAYLYIDLQSGAVTASGVTGGSQAVANASIAAGVNGYYKGSIDMKFSASTNGMYLIIALSDVATFGAPLDSNSPDYTGDNASGAYIWRPKLVQL